MNRRQMLTTTGLGITGFAVGTGFTAPACGVTKAKAVKVSGFVIELSKEAVPLLDLLGARDIADQFNTTIIPAMEKLKNALADADVPEAGTLLENVRSALSVAANALLNLPDTARRTTIIGILASVNIMLLTVEAFIESEMPDAAPAIAARAGHEKAGSRKSTARAIREAFEATRP